MLDALIVATSFRYSISFTPLTNVSILLPLEFAPARPSVRWPCSRVLFNQCFFSVVWGSSVAWKNSSQVDSENFKESTPEKGSTNTKWQMITKILVKS